MYFANMTGQEYRLSKEHSFVLMNGQNYSFTELDGRVDMGGVPAYNIFYIDSITNDSVFSHEYISTDTAVIPANSIGLIVTSYLNNPAASRKSNPPCMIKQGGISLEDVRNNMGSMWDYLCDGNARTAGTNVLQESARVYPNPATTSISVESSIKNARLQVFDQMGMRVYFDPHMKDKVDISVRELPIGMYHYLITGESGQESGHFIVQHR
jgi:hypothetical protein